MPLLDLNEDILYLIALVFERDRSTLCALAQVCRIFHRATKSVLYRHIGDISTEQQALLQRTFTNNPTLKSYVHSSSVLIELGEIQNNELSQACSYPNLNEITFIGSKKMRRLVTHVTGLAHMLLRIDQLRNGRDQLDDFQCGFLDTHQLSKIRTLRLVGNFTTTEIMRFMFLPSIQCLRAQDIGILRAPRLSSITQNLKLTTLSLTGDVLWSIEPQTMRSICLACPLLRNLNCQVPMITTFSGNLTYYRSRVTIPVSPAALNAVFEPIRGSLRQLSLLQLRHNVPYDGTYMDLSSFTKLTDLEITSCCLLPPGPPCPARDALHELLPLSLRNLSLDFPRESGIFYHHLEGEPFLSQNISAIPQSRYSWISCLLRNKEKHLPNLSNVHMQDPPGSIGHCWWKEAEWIASEDVRKHAQGAVDVLKVNISYPHPDSNSEFWNERRFKPQYGNRFFPWDE